MLFFLQLLGINRAFLVPYLKNEGATFAAPQSISQNAQLLCSSVHFQSCDFAFVLH